MAHYLIHGWTNGGWDVKDTATSLRKAEKVARNTMSGFSADSGSHVRIYKMDQRQPIRAWSGTTSGKWIPVTI